MEKYITVKTAFEPNTREYKISAEVKVVRTGESDGKLY